MVHHGSGLAARISLALRLLPGGALPACGELSRRERGVGFTWTRKISCYLCCFFGGCHWLPRRMKYQERPYNRTPLHSREAGREQTKTPQHIPFRLFIPRCRFRCILRFQKNAIHIGLTGFAESTVMRYLFCIEGASSPGDAYALSMATTLVLLGLAILPESGVPADANAWKDLI